MVFRIFENFILNVFFCNQVLELSKANQKQPGSPTFCVVSGAKIIFSWACKEKKFVS